MKHKKDQHKKKREHREKGSHGKKAHEDDSQRQKNMDTVAVEEKQEETTEATPEQAQDYLEHLQRLQAEFDNFRKRTAKEKLLLRSYVLEETVAGLLPVLDNFRRAMDSFGEGSAVAKSFIEGVEMIYMQFNDVLKNLGVSEIKALGEKFDPTIHEALGAEESQDEDNMVVKEIQKGYRLHERVIRPAAVVVSKKIQTENEKCSAEQFESDAPEAMDSSAEGE